MIDTHFHLWRRAGANQTGILAAPYLARDVRWDHFLAAWEGLPVEQAVNVPIRDFVDGAVEARCVAAEADPEFCLRPEYVRGVRLLGELGLVCDMCVRLEQVRALPSLVRSCPETTVVLEHLGKPDLGQPPPAYWMRAIEELAALPNAAAKLSVVVHTADDPPLIVDAAAPFVHHLVACVGMERLMFGSNWPVSTAVIDYRGWVDLVRELAGDDQRIWSATARRVYQLR